MEPIQRLLMMLRPDNASVSCESGTPLRMWTVPDGIALSLRAACLDNGDYDAYLFLKNGRHLSAGKIIGGILQTSMPGVALEDIKGAAVVQTTDDRPVFCLKSTGMDWDATVARFKIAHTPTPEIPHENKTETLHKAAQNIPGTAAPSPPPVSAQTPMPRNVATTPPPPLGMSADEPETCDACPHAITQRRINPFPAVFPGSEWIKISYPGPTGWWHYISGTIRRGNKTARVLGVPGEYSMAPPIWLEGFGTYLRSAEPDARGYWLMFQDERDRRGSGHGSISTWWVRTSEYEKQ